MSATQQLLRFGVFELNLTTEELRKGDLPVKLAPQPLRLLALLASRAGQVVDREEIQRQFWGEETEIDFERRMNQCVKQIRSALGDNVNNPLYIETVHRHGYRFIAPVQSKTVTPAPPHVVHSPTSGFEGAIAVTPSLQGSVAGTAVAPAAQVQATASRRRLTRRWLFVSAAALLVLLSGGLYLRARGRPVLTEKDTIVLADFDNKTGDPVFDDTLKQALGLQLEQSPYLNVLPDMKVANTLKQMKHAATDRLVPDVAREVCLRSNSKAMLTGSIAALGNEYVIVLKAVDCSNGDVLAESRQEAAGKEQVLKALDTTAVGMRRKLGESLASLQKYAMPLAEATTPSLEALTLYTHALRISRVRGETAALPFDQRAVELDPNFALAYADMASSYNNLNQPERAAENARKAYELRARVSERERFVIDADYYELVTGELDKAAQVYEVWQQSYPRDVVPTGNLTAIYGILGNWEKVLEAAQASMRLAPDAGAAYVNLGNAYVNLNRLDEAAAVYNDADKRKLESELLLANRYLLAFLKGDTSQMGQLLAAAMGKPGTEDLLFATQANTEAWHGRLEKARELTRRAMDSAEHNDAKGAAALYKVAVALSEVQSGERDRARADADAALKLAPSRDVQASAALTLAQTGDTARAEKLAAELDQSFPLDTMVQSYWLPTIRAAIALQRNDPSQAIEQLNTVRTIELGGPTALYGYLSPVYLRGQAYLMSHDGKAAAGEFQKYVDHYGLVANFPPGALARLGLARAYALEAATDPAARDRTRIAYQNFLALWKDADPGIPIYQQAKAEYARLQ